MEKNIKVSITKTITVNSVSGGMTSGFIYANYKADYDIFSLVCVDDPKCSHPDKFFMDYANQKIEKYSAHYGEVIGTAEDPIIFKTLYELEQLIGREIIWVRHESFDKWIVKKQGLPGKAKGSLGRWCTDVLKILPQFEFWYKYLNPEIIGVNVGFRADESERKKQFTTTYSMPISCNYYGKNRQNWIRDHTWRYGIFKLIEDGIYHPHIVDFWRSKNVTFPEDSNCQQCIFKKLQQIAKNSITCPSQMNWAQTKENEIGYRWHNDFSIEKAKRTPLQNDFVFGTGAGCTAGECIS
jgi:hypothetical protein